MNGFPGVHPDPENEEHWQQEATAVIKDVQDHVKHMSIATNLPNTNQRVFFNLTTLEGQEMCVCLSGAGFVVVGDRHGREGPTDGRVFETPYSLLESISPMYRVSFGGQLMSKLVELQQTRLHDL